MAEAGERNTILVMDDEEMVSEIACQMLEFLGLQSVCVADGREAIRVYQEYQEKGQPFTAVIMDLTIPGGMGGKEAVTEILALDKEAKVYVSSGYANDPVMLDYKSYGFSGVIAKPFDLNAIKQLLAPYL